jgi:hypothetical protein
MKQFLKVLLALIALLLTTSRVKAQTNPVNIALHKPVTFNVKPNYSLCTDPDDDIQLTDGKYSGDEQEVQKTRALWVQKSTVGWQNKNPVVITIDLGSVQPISGASFSTAAAPGNVYWPTSIFIATSDDGNTWHDAGNLIQLSRKNGQPPAEGYAAFRYVTHDLKTKGRYVAFGVDSTPFVFCDEIEIYRGDDAWLNQPAPGRIITSMEKFVPEMAITSAAQQRINDDIDGIRDAINASDLSAASKSTFIVRLQKDADAAEQMDALPKTFKAILPINDIHRDVLAVRGEFLATQGFKPITLWKQHRYAWLPLLAKPNQQEKTELNFSMLKNQFRSDNLLLTNAGAQSQTVTLQLQNPPQNAENGWLQIYSVAWTDTAQGTPVADALFPVLPQNGVYTIDIPAGMTRKVWFTIDSSKLPAGISKSTFAIKSGNQSFSVPLNLDIAKTIMNTPRFSLGMWDYSNGNSYAIKDNNRQAAIALMRSHFVNTAWGTRNVLPWPAASAFDAQGNLTATLDFSAFDQWGALWPGNKNFFVYAAVGNTFAGAKMGTAEFDARVGSWAKVLSAHMKELNLQPGQLGICLVDEPHTDAQDATIATWAKAIKTTAPELTLFEDPAAARLGENKNQDSIAPIDIICPALSAYFDGGRPLQKYFQQLQAQGKQQWFYQCTGPVRLYDPQLYYRYQAWHAFADGATGEGFWSFSDISKALSSFSEYGTGRINYAPVFFDGDMVYDSVHWDAVREGVEDYEELAMLRDAIKSSNNATWKQQAQQTLDEAIKTVTGIWKKPVYDWNQKSDAELADTQLRKVRNLLKNHM